MDEETLQYHKDTGMFAVAYEPQAQGYFHKYLKNGFDSLPDVLKLCYPEEQNKGRVQRLERLAKQEGLSVSNIVLGYLADWSFPSCAIIGCHSVEQVRDSMEAASCVLTDEQKKYLTEGTL